MFNICFLTLQLHICDILSQCYVFLCWIPPWRWPNKAKTCKRLAIWLYTFVYNCCARVGINTVQITVGLQIIKLAITTSSFLHHPFSTLNRVNRVKYCSHHPVLLSSKICSSLMEKSQASYPSNILLTGRSKIQDNSCYHKYCIILWMNIPVNLI